MDHEMMRRLHGGSGGKFERISHRVRLLSKVQIAEDTWLLRFEKPSGFTYRAGQHVRMSLIKPRVKDPAGNARFWSFASAPFEPDLAFAIRSRPSPFKTELMRLAVGSEVLVEMLKNPPHGAFAMDDSDVPAVFLAGGIGVVPAYSMIKQALNDGSRRSLTLFYSNRRLEDGPFLDELALLAERNTNFKFVPTFTQSGAARPKTETGRISLEMIRRHVADPGSARFYISGLKSMVEDLQALLGKAGVPSTSIQSEEFGSFSVGRAKPKPLFGTLSLAGLAIVGLIVAAHLAPVLIITKSHPILWLKAHPISLGIAAALAAIVVIKVTLVLLFRRSGRSLH